MGDVDSLLDELDGLLKDEPKAPAAARPSRAPSFTGAPSCSSVALPTASGDDDIDSLLADLGQSPAAAPVHAAPRAAPPRLPDRPSASSVGSLAFPSSSDADTATK